MTTLFHVSSVRNRASIMEHGLDWTRMGAASGIAGAARPEVQGVNLCVEDGEAEWFIEIINTGGSVDLWEITGIDVRELVEAPNGGRRYLGRPIPPAQLDIVRKDISPQPWPARDRGRSARRPWWT